MNTDNLTPGKIAQFVLDNRYPKSPNDMISDLDLFHMVKEKVNNLIQMNYKPIKPPKSEPTEQQKKEATILKNQKRKGNAIKKATSKVTEIPINEMISPSRKREVVNARQIAQYVMKRKTKLSLSMIGRITGGLKHCSVMHSCKVINNELAYDNDLKQTIELIERGF